MSFCLPMGLMSSWAVGCSIVLHRGGPSWRVKASTSNYKIIDGPYKPPIVFLERPNIVFHLGVFTELSYLVSPPLKRWAWRKYSCLIEPDRLKRLAPGQPDLTELLYGPKGVEYRLSAIASGSVTMNELVLPSFREVTFSHLALQTKFRRMLLRLCVKLFA